MWNKIKTWVSFAADLKAGTLSKSLFPLTFTVPMLVHPVSCFRQMPVVGFDLFTPPPSANFRKALLGLCWGCVWFCICGDDVSSTKWVKTDVLKTDCVMSADRVKGRTVLYKTQHSVPVYTVQKGHCIPVSGYNTSVHNSQLCKGMGFGI